MEISYRTTVETEPVISYCHGFRIGIIDEGNDIDPLYHIRSLLPFDRWRLRSHGKFKCHVYGLVWIPPWKHAWRNLVPVPWLSSGYRSASIVIPVACGGLPAPWIFVFIRHDSGDGDPVDGPFLLLEWFGKVHAVVELMFIRFIRVQD